MVLNREIKIIISDIEDSDDGINSDDGSKKVKVENNISPMTFDLKSELERMESINDEVFDLLKQKLKGNGMKTAALLAIAGLQDGNEIVKQIETLKLEV